AVITGKANTMLQMILIVLILAGVTGTLITILIWIIVALVIVSTAENFIKNKQVIKCLFS
ncbi:MAG: hypothetical protein FWC51_02700, partial [Proteobacteria bacterium]|nr:hypothetical protein [Pseudomonadota bacterium]